MLCQIRSCRASTIAATRASPAYGCPLPLTVICVLNNLPRFRTQCHEPSKDLGLHGREVRPQDEKRIWSAHGFPTASSRLPHGFLTASSRLPHGFPTASSRLPHGLLTASSQLPHGFLLPHGFPTASSSQHYRCVTTTSQWYTTMYASLCTTEYTTMYTSLCTAK